MALTDGHQQPGLHDVAGLFRERHAELVRLAALVVGDRATAEDVVQDVFARLCARNLLPDQEHSLAYVRAAVLNGCRSVLRRRALVRRIGGARDPDRSDPAPDSAEDEVILAEGRVAARGRGESHDEYVNRKLQYFGAMLVHVRRRQRLHRHHRHGER
jgi:DNA-directed RNA polymerase specialized sigma24 family protein